MTHFNQIANEWDTPEKSLLNQQYSAKIKSLLPEKSPQKILEIGCGTGLLGSNFINEKNILIGVDTSKGMLEVFNQKLKNHKNAKSNLLNLEENDLNESEFDLIISSMAFHHLKRPDLIIAKLKAMLSKNGAIAIIDLADEDGTFHPEPAKMGVFHSGFSEEITRSWATKASLQNTHREIIHTINKNGKSYPVFLAIYSNS